MLPCVIVVFVLLSCACGENPAVQVILTNKGLQYGKHEGTGWIQEKLEKITFPDISGSVNIHIGRVYYTLSGVTIKKCDLPEPSVEFVQQSGLTTSIAGLSFALAGEWRNHFGLIHDSGSFDMAIFNIDVTSAVKLGSNAGGHLSVTSVNCTASVGDVSMQFHGGASWIFQPFVKYFKGHIIGIIQSKICPEVEDTIMNLDHHLQAMNVSFDVNEVLSFDVPLTGDPDIEPSNMKLGFKGEFHSIETHAEPPFVAQEFVLPELAGYMLSVGLSEFTLNSASFGYFSAGQLQAFINDSMIPPYIPFRLNTSAMGGFIPQLPKMYPGLLMNLQVNARDAPMFSFQPGSGVLDVHICVKASATESNGTQVPLFTLYIDSRFTGKMMIADGKLKGSMMLNNVTLTLGSSEIGDFKTDALENGIKSGMVVVLGKLNAKLGEGIMLPRMKHAQLVNTVLKMQKGFVGIYSDVQILQTDRSSYLSTSYL
ncbi:lipopolysaccharide-binding protein [Poecilia latipinna]|uniref:Bactericidal permeability-increasing protein n=1 Tax=Poecilia latipinna TaxID=48699 RepID=A0A3B3VEY3_9TELE|nr:PREDICTED: lipopolysaccharide-binding protein-like [Poecilia latipinna]